MIININGMKGETWINRFNKKKITVYSGENFTSTVIIFGKEVTMPPDSYLVLFDSEPVERFKILDINELCDNYDRVQ